MLQVAMSGGSGSGDATSVITGGGQDLTKSVGQVKNGSNDTRRRTPQQLRKELEKAERESMQRLKARIEQALQAPYPAQTVRMNGARETADRIRATIAQTTAAA